MIYEVHINGFKCFKDNQIRLGNATLFLGVNSGGKSTSIQSILLGSLSENKSKVNLIDNQFNMNLNSFNDVINTDRSDYFSIKLDFGNEGEYEFKYEEGDYPHILNVTEEKNGEFKIPQIVYLPANRNISRLQVAGDSEDWSVGENNQHMGFIIENSRKLNRIPFYSERNFFENVSNVLLDIQINDWLNYILPNNEVSAQNIKYSQQYILEFNSKLNPAFTAENVGFGVAFILPIILSGLTMKQNSVLIIENPEIHLHPKAQSNLAMFLAVIASSGVQVVIETHSDHIVNGFRKAVLYSSNDLSHKDLVINYFNQEFERQIVEIVTSESAELESWPSGFMDQSEEDLFELRKLRRSHD